MEHYDWPTNAERALEILIKADISNGKVTEKRMYRICGSRSRN